ncbi:hypothetical protein VPH35_035576 [Triticum aestivum]
MSGKAASTREPMGHCSRRRVRLPPLPFPSPGFFRRRRRSPLDGELHPSPPLPHTNIHLLPPSFASEKPWPSLRRGNGLPDPVSPFHVGHRPLTTRLPLPDPSPSLGAAQAGPGCSSVH